MKKELAGETPKKRIERLFAGEHYSDEYGERVDIMVVHEGWCMVRKGSRKPFVVAEEYLLAMFNP